MRVFSIQRNPFLSATNLSPFLQGCRDLQVLDVSYTGIRYLPENLEEGW
jgi:hypothetical protein